MNDVNSATPQMDENGLFDIDDENVLVTIAGGLSQMPSVLDNHCVTNDSKCGVSK